MQMSNYELNIFQWMFFFKTCFKIFFSKSKSLLFVWNFFLTNKVFIFILFIVYFHKQMNWIKNLRIEIELNLNSCLKLAKQHLTLKNWSIQQNKTLIKSNQCNSLGISLTPHFNTYLPNVALLCFLSLISITCNKTRV